MRFNLLVLRAGLTVAFALPSASVYANPVKAYGGSLLPGQIEAGYHQSLSALKQRALLQKQQDGGNLTSEHVGLFQRQLDVLNSNYYRRLLNHNPLSVNADGSARNPRNVTADWTATPLIQGTAAN